MDANTCTVFSLSLRFFSVKERSPRGINERARTEEENIQGSKLRVAGTRSKFTTSINQFAIYLNKDLVATFCYQVCDFQNLFLIYFSSQIL